MKNIILTLSLFTCLLTFSNPIELDIQEVATKVSEQNYLVLENAQSVYQSKERIKFSRAALYPKLNIWRLLKIPSLIIDPLGIGDIIQDIAPFLVPANWFAIKKDKALYEAQRIQYQAVVANEISTAKLLFMSVYRDQRFLQLIAQKSQDYKVLLDIARSRNTFGQGSVFAANLIEARALSLIEDRKNLENLNNSNLKELQYLVGINNESDVALITPEIPTIEHASQLEFSKIVFKALESSPELRQFDEVFNALNSLRSSVGFNILGTSTHSSGSGAFSNIPIQDGLGFGTSSSIRISESQKEIVKIQKKATTETIKKQVSSLVFEYNSIIDNFEIIKKRHRLALANHTSLLDFLAVGGDVDALEMIEILDNLYAAKILTLSYELRFSDLIEKLKRITFSDDYTALITQKSSYPKKVKTKEVVKAFKDLQVKKSLLLNEFSIDLLVDYSKSVESLNLMLDQVEDKKYKRKRLIRYLKKDELLKDLCPNTLLSFSLQQAYKGQCDESELLNLCPSSFNQLTSAQNMVTDRLVALLSSDELSTSMCISSKEAK